MSILGAIYAETAFEVIWFSFYASMVKKVTITFVFDTVIIPVLCAIDKTQITEDILCRVI